MQVATGPHSGERRSSVPRSKEQCGSRGHQNHGAGVHPQGMGVHRVGLRWGPRPSERDYWVV